MLSIGFKDFNDSCQIEDQFLRSDSFDFSHWSNFRIHVGPPLKTIGFVLTAFIPVVLLN